MLWQTASCRAFWMASASTRLSGNGTPSLTCTLTASYEPPGTTALMQGMLLRSMALRTARTAALVTSWPC